ncbi:MAG: hypothetical protein KAW92_02210 [Candidatus Cloacimonetes bacterium]|nr:hypothetical protein [Candidatus Cloacimonadota bacterium]
MIRIYFDWNVISNLKRQENKELKSFINTHKDYLQFPYSPAHFNDLMKGYSPDNKYFQEDIETLEYLAGKHLIRWEKNRTMPLFGAPKEYLEGEKNKEDIFSLMDMEKVFSDLDETSEDLGLGKMGNLMKSLFKLQPIGFEVNEDNEEMLQKMFPSISSNSSMWDLMKEIGPFSKKLLQDKDYYKDFRKTIGNKGFKVEPNAGNWNVDEVIDKIDEFLEDLDTNITFTEYVESAFKHRKEPINRYEFFTTAYLMLDMIGYKADKLPKPTDNMQNISTDGEHAFYGAHCDFFVACDKNLRIKAEVLYTKFNISTKVLSPTEFKNSLEKVIHKFPNETNNIIEDALKYIDFNSIVEYYPVSEENEVETYAFKLPIFYFNFFNYVVYRFYKEHNSVVLTFKRAFKNYSDFIFYTEAERLIDKLTELFGYDDLDELKKRKKEFIYENKETQFIWQFKGGLIILEKDTETKRPNLTYMILIDKKNTATNNG